MVTAYSDNWFSQVQFIISRSGARAINSDTFSFVLGTLSSEPDIENLTNLWMLTSYLIQSFFTKPRIYISLRVFYLFTSFPYCAGT